MPAGHALWHLAFGNILSYYIRETMLLYKVKPVYKDHQRELVRVGFLGSWSLYKGSTNMNLQHLE